jgi:hypothetical protein
MKDEQPDRLDLILNAAIRDYSNAEPRAGLELRILRHVQARPHKRFPWRRAWALVIAAIALIVLIALPARRAPLPPLALLPPPVPRAAQPVIPTPLIPEPSAQPRTSDHRSFRRSQEPGPLPLTAEERALLRLVQEHPEQAVAVLSQPAIGEFEALTIEPLKIEKLQ